MACPDPVDFRAYTLVNLYEDRNAYRFDEPFKGTPVPGHRDRQAHRRDRPRGGRALEGELRPDPHPPAGLGGPGPPAGGQSSTSTSATWTTNYLNNAVHLAEEFLEATEDPHYAGEVDYGDRAEHCWNGDHTRPNAISRLRYIQMFAPRMVERMMGDHLPGADLASWRY